MEGGVSNSAARVSVTGGRGGVTSETSHIHPGSPRVSGGPWHRPAEAQPVLTDHANDGRFPPLRHLITSCPGVLSPAPRAERATPFLSYSVSPRTEPIKELIHFSTLHPFNYEQC